MDEATFDAGYRLSKKPAIRALLDMAPFSGERATQAATLAKQGEIIDEQIDAIGADAYWTMLIRAVDNWGWVASYLQPQSLGPGVTFPTPGFVPYTSTPPPGSILVIDPRTATAADLKPFDPPAAVQLPAASVLIGPMFAPGEYKSGADAFDANFQPVVESGKEYAAPDGSMKIAHVTHNPFSWLVVFTDPGVPAPF